MNADSWSDPTEDAADGLDHAHRHDLRLVYARLRAFAAVAADLDQEPDDLVQDAFAAYLAIAQKRKINSLEAYLRVCVVNAVMTRRRTMARRPQLVVLDDEADLPATTVDHDADGVRLLSDLKPIDRALVYAVDIEGYATAAAAEFVGISAVAARARLSRARRRLRAMHLNRNEEDE